MGALASDTFTRADAANLGGNWTIAPSTDSSWGAVAINTNTAQVVADPSAEYYSAISWPNDQYALATVGTATAISSTQVGIITVRAGAASGSCYFLEAGTDKTQLFKLIGDPATTGTYTQLGSDGSSIASGDQIRLEAVGTTITAKKNGVTIIGPSTDSGIASGSPGIGGFWHSGTHQTFTYWEGGDFSGGVPFFVQQDQLVGGMQTLSGGL